jgi:hypothetical protein
MVAFEEGEIQIGSGEWGRGRSIGEGLATLSLHQHCLFHFLLVELDATLQFGVSSSTAPTGAVCDSFTVHTSLLIMN